MTELITKTDMRELGSDMKQLLDAYELQPEERVMALLAAVYAEAAQAGLSGGQLKDRMSRVFVECQRNGIKLRDQHPPTRRSQNGTGTPA